MSIKKARNEALLPTRIVVDRGPEWTCRELEQELERVFGLKVPSASTTARARMKPAVERQFSKVHSTSPGLPGKGAA